MIYNSRDKLKILWYTNIPLTLEDQSISGTWLAPLATALVNTGHIELHCISSSNVSKVMCFRNEKINQWLIPHSQLRSNGLPNKKVINSIKEIVDNLKPDLAHIWGTENYWGLLYSRSILNGTSLLEIQGLKYAISNYFISGLEILDVFKCFTLKELLRPQTSILGKSYAFRKWGKYEREMISFMNNVSVQSNWSFSHVLNLNKSANILRSNILLRDEFLFSEKWDINKITPYKLFTSLSEVSTSYKGLHVLFEAIVILKKKYPLIKLYVAGNVPKSGIRMDGYFKLLMSKAKKYSIDDKIIFLGSLTAKELITQIKSSNVIIFPSFVESFSVSFEEALHIGAPCVSAFSGALPERATHNEDVLFYPPLDIESCAYHIGLLLTDKSLIKELSENSLKKRLTYRKEDIVDNQLINYRRVIPS